jgi:hypothetical protein
MLSKRCFKCNEEKALSDYYRHPQMADGHLNKCIKCTKKDVREHRVNNPERVRAYDRMRAKRPERIEASRAIWERWRAQNPERRAAQLQLGYAVRAGKIQKLPCLICGEEKAEAHHPDYSAPLAVVWLCSPHHHQAHHTVTEAEA